MMFYELFYSNGWLRTQPTYDYATYKMQLYADYKYECYAQVSENEDHLNNSGYYGINWIDVKPLDFDIPYGLNELEDMKEAIIVAENNLLTIGVPFIEDYAFNGRNAANKKRRNDALRRKLKIEELEKEGGWIGGRKCGN